jgi:hypothetical protein
MLAMPLGNPLKIATTMEPLVVSTNEKQPVIQWGAQKKTLMGDAGAGLGLGGVAGFGVELPPDHPRPAGWGAVPGSGVSF